jgi:hypothetical protein
MNLDQLLDPQFEHITEMGASAHDTQAHSDTRNWQESFSPPPSEHGNPSGPHFAPQRLFPRFAGALNLASHIPGGLGLSSTLLRPISENDLRSDFERPTVSQLARSSVAVTGFPRTGSTYFSFLVNAAFSSASACWKSHDAFAFAGYVAAGIPAVLTLREPIGTVASWSLYNSDVPSTWLMRRRLQTYCAWHRDVLRGVEHLPITIARFEEFTLNHNTLINGLIATDEAHSADLTFDVDEFSERTNQHDLPKQQRHLPCPERDAAKRDYLTILDSSSLLPLLLSAEKLHHELWMRAEDQSTHVSAAASMIAANAS